MLDQNVLNAAAQRLQEVTTVDVLDGLVKYNEGVQALLADPSAGPGWQAYVERRRQELVPASPTVPVAPAASEAPVAPQAPAAPAAPEAERQETPKASAETAAGPFDIVAMAKAAQQKAAEFIQRRLEAKNEIIRIAQERGLWIDFGTEITMEEKPTTVFRWLVYRVMDGETTTEKAVEEAKEMGWTSPIERDFDQATYHALMEELDRRSLFLHARQEDPHSGEKKNVISELCIAIEAKQISVSQAVDLAVTARWTSPRRDEEVTNSVADHIIAKEGSRTSSGGPKRGTARRK